MNHTSPNSQNDLQSLSPLHSSHRVRRSVAMSNSTSGIERTARRLTSFEVWICRQWSGVYRCEFESLVQLCHISLNSRWIYFVSSVCLSCKLDFILFCCVSIRLLKIIWLHGFTSRQILREEKGNFCLSFGRKHTGRKIAWIITHLFVHNTVRGESCFNKTQARHVYSTWEYFKYKPETIVMCMIHLYVDWPSKVVYMQAGIAAWLWPPLNLLGRVWFVTACSGSSYRSGANSFVMCCCFFFFL